MHSTAQHGVAWQGLTWPHGHARVKHIQRAVPAVGSFLGKVVLDALIQGVQLVVPAVHHREGT